MKKTTAKYLWTYDKEVRSPYLPKDETLYGLYMATVLKNDGIRRKAYPGIKEAEEAYKKGELPVNVECVINEQRTTYGRRKLTEICNIDVETFLQCHHQIKFEDDKPVLLDPEYDNIPSKIESWQFILPEKAKGEPDSIYKDRCDKVKKKYKEELDKWNKFQTYKKENNYKSMNALGMNNIPAFILAMAKHPNREIEYLEMQKFANEIATIYNLGVIPYQDIFTGHQEDIDKILKAEFKGDKNNPEATRAEAQERISKLQKLFKNIVESEIKNLPDSNIRELEQSLGKMSVNKLLTVYCPYINGNDLDENLFAYMKDDLFDGLSEQSYYAMAGQNRGTLELKQDMVPTSR